MLVMKYSISRPICVGRRVAVSVAGAGVKVGCKGLVGVGPPADAGTDVEVGASVIVGGMTMVGIRVGVRVGRVAVDSDVGISTTSGSASAPHAAKSRIITNSANRRN